MSIFAIGDLHLSLGGAKPMDIFPGWEGYLPKLETHWRRLIAPEDTVILAGDTSWAMTLQGTGADFAFLQSLPGQKWLLKGNHDYWWTTANKMNRYLAEKGFDTLHILHNNAYLVEDKLICGTRGWLFDIGEPQDEKVMNREVGRLNASLDAADAIAGGLPEQPERLVFLHYPPKYLNYDCPDILRLLDEYGVELCCYGHLHAASCAYSFNGKLNDTQFRLVSADYVNFTPQKLL